MSPELEERLAKLAPEIDVERARAVVRARQSRSARRRRALFSGAVVAACAAVLAGVVAISGNGSGTQDGDVAAGERDGDLQTTAAEAAGIEVAVTAPEQAMAGTRLWFDVVVRNNGSSAVYWQSGGCAIPVRAIAGPASEVALPDESTSADEPPRWDGDVSGLAEWLADHNTLKSSQPHQPEDATGARAQVCTDDLNFTAVEPGDELRHRGSVELRVPPGAVPDDGSYRLLVEFQAYTDPEGYPDNALAPVTVEVPLTVVDDPARGPDTADGAVAAFTADPRLEPWIESTEVEDRPDLGQSFDTELSWWRGAWELWLEPYWEGSQRLRMRYDPTTDEVADVRTVYLGRAPEDEPGAVVPPDHPESDEILGP